MRHVLSFAVTALVTMYNVGATVVAPTAAGAAAHEEEEGRYEITAMDVNDEPGCFARPELVTSTDDTTLDPTNSKEEYFVDSDCNGGFHSIFTTEQVANQSSEIQRVTMTLTTTAGGASSVLFFTIHCSDVEMPVRSLKDGVVVMEVDGLCGQSASLEDNKGCICFTRRKGDSDTAGELERFKNFIENVHIPMIKRERQKIAQGHEATRGSG